MCSASNRNTHAHETSRISGKVSLMLVPRYWWCELCGSIGCVMVSPDDNFEVKDDPASFSGQASDEHKKVAPDCAQVLGLNRVDSTIAKPFAQRPKGTRGT